MKLIFKLSPLAVIFALTACADKPTYWNRDCDKYFSTTDREKSQCIQKIKDNKLTSIEAGAISLDPENTTRQSFDSIGKNGATDDN